MDIRVYVLAKELGVTSKDLIAFFHDVGVDVASHMSTLSQKSCDLARKKFAISTSSKKPEVESKKTVAAKKENKDSLNNKPAKAKEITSKQEEKTLKKQHVSPVEEPIYQDSEEDIVHMEVDEASPVKSSGLKGEDRFVRMFSVAKPKKTKRRKYKRAHKEQSSDPVEVTGLVVKHELPLFEVASLMGKQSSELIGALLRRGKICNINQILSVDVIRDLAEQFGLEFSVEKAQKADDNVRLTASSEGETRWPVVVIMGHVDHGKTSLLDNILKTNVASREKGGITQHISVYQVTSAHGKITFLDTPGHEAFSYLRKRGAHVTDIVVLVVAADDGIMPQTVEAIKHAQEAQVPIIVAINKVDKPGAEQGIETVKRQLAQHNLMSEDWGGDVICVPVSAKTGKGVDALLDMISLQAQMMELKGRPELPGKAFVLETRLDKGYGPVATIICTEGTIAIGDFFTCGNSTGKVRLLIDSFGNKMSSVGPATPANIIGFNGAAAMGDWLSVVSPDVYSKARSGKYDDKLSVSNGMSSEQMVEDEVQNVVTLVLKTDTRGSLEGILSSIEKLLKAKKGIGCTISIASRGIGDITENDVDFASGIGAQVIGFNVKAEKNALSMAKDKQVDISLFSIIYGLIDHLEKELESRKIIKKTWKKTGEALVKKVFDIKGIGIVAGCYLKEGTCSRSSKVACVRGRKTVGEGKITSLQRERKSVKEVHAGFEFGFSSDTFQDWQEDDIVECFAEVEVTD